MAKLFTAHRPKSAAKPPAKAGSAPAAAERAARGPDPKTQGKPKEIGGPEGPEPTRYGDWERNGICYDF
jgi:hypothetical protein